MSQHAKIVSISFCMLAFGILIQLIASEIVYKAGFGDIEGQKCKKCLYEFKVVDAKIVANHCFRFQPKEILNHGNPECIHSFIFYGGHQDGSITEWYFVLIKLSLLLFLLSFLSMTSAIYLFIVNIYHHHAIKR